MKLLGEARQTKITLRDFAKEELDAIRQGEIPEGTAGALEVFHGRIRDPYAHAVFVTCILNVSNQQL